MILDTSSVANIDFCAKKCAKKGRNHKAFMVSYKSLAGDTGVRKICSDSPAPFWTQKIYNEDFLRAQMVCF